MHTCPSEYHRSFYNNIITDNFCENSWGDKISSGKISAAVFERLWLALIVDFSESIFKNVHLVLDVPYQAGNGCLIIDDVDALSVGVVADGKWAGNCSSKLPV